jgi:S-adenosylmethionine:diacylglycerol 3-amino-3-carboxypropyl transferase
MLEDNNNKYDEYNCPIYFSQVREDSNIEKFIINKCLLKFGKNINIFMIASGGCNILNICKFVADLDTINDPQKVLSNCIKRINKIYAIDKNRSQIELLKLKSYMVSSLGTGFYVKDMLNNGFNFETYELFLKGLDKNSIEYWIEHKELLKRGVNRVGRYEQLFKDVCKNENDKIKNDFSNENLIKIFGENAVKQSTKNNFSEYFLNYINKIKNMDYKKNYILASFLNNGEYNNNRLVPYLSFDDRENKKEYECYIKMIEKINYEYSCLDIIESLEKIEDQSLNVIQTSNITDWMDDANMRLLFDLILKKLKYKGYVIMRRLNSDIVLTDFVVKNYKNYFIIDNNYEDSTYLYSEVLILKKI